MNKTRPLRETAGFLLAKLGQQALQRFSDKLAPLGLRPKHGGALTALAALEQPSQQELGKALGVVPSAIVAVIDDLEAVGALERLLDPDDRRRFRLQLTAHGRNLAQTVMTLANEVDNELLAQLTSSQQAELSTLLLTVAHP